MPFFRSSFSSFASKWGKDSRFKGVEKMREKEDIFNEYVQELDKKEKEERKEKKEKVVFHFSHGSYWQRVASAAHLSEQVINNF